MHFITVGEPKLSYAKSGWEEYYGRLRRYHSLKVTRLRDLGPDLEGKAILRAAGNAHLMPLDPRGKQFTSEDLSRHLETLALHGTGEIALVIGGPVGLSDEVRAAAGTLWSLSKLTLPHDLAMVVMLEALYRASSIARGEPYHRG
nr:23S rRNA (pseudouridine(1915)-N(3))-methyltransferase RlmH [Deinobacterium chartae]